MQCTPEIEASLSNQDDQFGRSCQSLDMSTFLVSSAHDMKNSISVMTVYLEAALQDTPPPEGASFSPTELTKQALYEAKRLNDRLIQILALCKLNMGLYPFDPAEVELRGFVDEVLARVRPLAEAKGITLASEISTSEPAWYFDYELVLGVVVQALHNAIKYTRDTIRVCLHADRERLEIRVVDNGVGYPPFMLEQGYPARQSVDIQTGSTGLGLHFAALAAGIHRNQGRTGHTRLENNDGCSGGCFILALP